MNKWIKNKKRFIMNSRKSSTKEENLFAKQFQRLYISCEAVNINRLTITRLYKYVLRNKFMTKDEFQLSIRMILFNICKGYKDASQCDLYLNFYNYIGIKFHKENDSVKIEFKGRC
ncbi:hypothetical protein [Clostridium sp. ZBS18]|uniref:hypothetical protein n=1 Tax=Clostridium sp. ZBS18 TaxID=2949967 RepID=UPI002079CB03|nr:hypothetical protein [Clostridium sp. ZBS18]